MSDHSLIDAWRSYLSSSIHGLHLIDATHPLQIFVGSTDQAQPRLVIRSAIRPPKPVLSGVVKVERFEDQGGSWSLNFVLQDAKFTEVFLRLADDLHSRSAGANSEANALDRVSTVFDEWRRLLKPRPSGLLSMDELRGLIGELWLLHGEFAMNRSMDAAIEGWLGPLGLPQDFWYPEDGYHEVKSIGPSTERVRISSEGQLDVSDLELIVLHVANTTEETAGALNLPILLTRIESALTQSGSSLDPFNDRIQRLGVAPHESFYQDTWFSVVHLDGYRVTPDFPAIRASRLDDGLGRVLYEIELKAIEEFKDRSSEVD